MTDKVKNTALVVSSLAALALGGSAIAGCRLGRQRGKHLEL